MDKQVPGGSGRDPFLRLEDMLSSQANRIDRHRDDLARYRDELADAQDALMTLRARLHNEDEGGARPGIEYLAPSIARPFIDNLASSVDRIENVVLDADVGAGSEDVALERATERISRGMRLRTIYTEQVLTTPEGRVMVETLREAGEEQRVSDAITTEFAIFGDEAVIMLSAFGDPSSPYLLIREPSMVQATRSWFELVWASAPEVGHGREGDEALVRLLALGMKDESIARYLGVALRTVRRRVARLMDSYGVSTRFQLGAALQRDGRL